MTKRYNHFDTYEWLGLFWTPGREIEFPGRLTYSPEDGITLDFMCSVGTEINGINYIHGILSSGEQCTLFGKFSPENFGFHFGDVNIYRGKPKFQAAIFGFHATPDDEFRGFSLDLSNFQEFCHPQGWKDLAKYSSEPLFKGEVGDLIISIINTGTFTHISNNISNLFHCNNPEAVDEITKSIVEISKRYKDDEILRRRDIGWEFWVESKSKIKYSNITRNISIIENLISLLVFSPVRRTDTCILIESEIQGRFKRVPFLSNLFDIGKNELSVLKRELSNLHLPIVPRNIRNFSDVITSWFEKYDGFQSFAPQVANRFGRYHEHELRAAIVLNLAQIEAICHILGSRKGEDKYDLPISTYDKAGIREILKSLICSNDDSKIGSRLGELRGEIAHVGRPIRLLPRLGAIGLLRVNRCLELIIASHIYKNIGIAESNIIEFQRLQSLV